MVTGGAGAICCWNVLFTLIARVPEVVNQLRDCYLLIPGKGHEHSFVSIPIDMIKSCGIPFRIFAYSFLKSKCIHCRVKEVLIETVAICGGDGREEIQRVCIEGCTQAESL